MYTYIRGMFHKFAEFVNIINIMDKPNNTMEIREFIEQPSYKIRSNKNIYHTFIYIKNEKSEK